MTPGRVLTSASGPGTETTHAISPLACDWSGSARSTVHAISKFYDRKQGTGRIELHPKQTDVGSRMGQRNIGHFRTLIEVGKSAALVYHTTEPIVDTGATYSMLPASLLEKELGLSPVEEMTFTFADGEKRAYGLGEARFRYEGRERTTPVIFGPEDVYLLGAVSLESLGS